MPMYMIKGSYTTEGIKGFVNEGGTGRQAAAEALVRGVGGQLEAYWFAFGCNDFYLLAQLPDNVAAAALSVTAGASGAIAGLETVVLLSPAEMDAAVKMRPGYRPPGG